MRHRLELAGNPDNWTVSEFLGVPALGGIVVAGLGTVLAFALHMEIPLILLFLGIGGVLGLPPLLWLNRKIKGRQKAVQKHRLTRWDLLTICVESGLGFDAAMGKVAAKWDNELAGAFPRAISEIRVGKLRREALRDMAARIELSDFTNFIAAIIQARPTRGEHLQGAANSIRADADQAPPTRRGTREPGTNKNAHPTGVPGVSFDHCLLLEPTVLIFTSGGFNVK